MNHKFALRKEVACVKTAAQIMKSKRFIKAEMDMRMEKTESDALWKRAEHRLGEILAQYGGISKGEHSHTDNYIFPAAAIYLTLKETMEQKEAYDVIERSAIGMTTNAGKKLAGMMKLPGMKSLFVKIWDPMTRKMFGPNNGFKNVFYPKTKNEFRMDIIACPYCRYFTELGCPELTKIYCENDNRVYGNLTGLEFKRTGTLGTGAERCDFYLRKL